MEEPIARSSATIEEIAYLTKKSADLCKISIQGTMGEAGGRRHLWHGIVGTMIADSVRGITSNRKVSADTGALALGHDFGDASRRQNKRRSAN